MTAVTCEVCDLAAIRAAHAYAIEWHTFKGETKEVIDAVPSLLDALVAARAREAALTAEVERLTDAVGDEARARREAEATARSAESANRIMQAENARLMVALSSAESSRDGWKAVAEVRTRDLATARADAANARAVAEAACDLADGAIDNAPPSDSRDDGDLSSIAAGHALVATLRARLSSPEPAKEES